jgi:hypothetical protein
MVLGGNELNVRPAGCESFGEAIPPPQSPGMVTVTVNVHMALLPDASVAVQVTVVGFCIDRKRLPDGGVHVTVGFGQSSVTIGLNVTVATASPPSYPSQGTSMFCGQVIIGGIVSVQPPRWQPSEQG